MSRKLDRALASGTLGTQDVVVNTRSGFTVTVRAQAGFASLPNVTECDEDYENPCGCCRYDDDWEQCDYSGPYTHFQVDSPSERPEPWDKWQRYLRFPFLGPEGWRRCPFDFVPAAMVVALIKEHGGEMTTHTF